MQLFSSFLFAISASLDALIVGITYGMKRVHILSAQNFLVSLITLTGTVISIALGRQLAPLLPPQAATLAGSAILILLGGYYIIKYLLQTLQSFLARCKLPPGEIRKASAGEGSQRFSLTLRETILLGAALSVNNMGIGIGASIAGLTLLPTAILTLFFSVAFLYLGNRLGKIRLLQIADNLADPLSGLLLVGLGLYELLA